MLCATAAADGAGDRTGELRVEVTTKGPPDIRLPLGSGGMPVLAGGVEARGVNGRLRFGAAEGRGGVDFAGGRFGAGTEGGGATARGVQLRMTGLKGKLLRRDKRRSLTQKRTYCTGTGLDGSPAH